MKRTAAPSPSDLQTRRDAFYQDLRRDLSQSCKQYDPLSAELCFNIAQTYTRVAAELAEQALPTGLTLPGLNALIVLYKYKEAGCPLNSLSRLLIVSQANITGLVDSLARKGLVTRAGHAEDRRVVMARITAKGERLIKSYIPAHYGLMRQMTASLTKSEKEQLIRLLTHLRRHLLDHRNR